MANSPCQAMITIFTDTEKALPKSSGNKLLEPIFEEILQYTVVCCRYKTIPYWKLTSISKHKEWSKKIKSKYQICKINIK